MNELKREPQSISRNFNQAIQEASELYVREHYKAPELDPALLKKIKKSRKKSVYKRIVQIAAIFMVVAVGVSAGIWANADGAYGGKKIINKWVNIISPLDIEQKTAEDGSILETVTITDEKKIEDAGDFAEQLYMPEYIPSGYSFETLKIEKDADYIYQDYQYKKGKEYLTVSANINRTGVDTGLTVTGELYKSPVTGDDLYVAAYEGDEYSVARIGDKVDCLVGGIGDIKEGIKVMEGFKEMKSE